MSAVTVVRQSRVLRGPVIAGVSQGFSVIQILLMFVGTSAGSASDLYYVLATWTSLPGQILLTGLLYPIWMRNSRLGRAAEVSCIISCLVISQALLFVGVVVFSEQSGVSIAGSELRLQVLLYAPFALTSTFALACCLRLAASGKPEWISAQTLLSSVGACIGLASVLAFSPDYSVALSVRLEWMLLGQNVGMAAYLLVLFFAIRSVSAHDVSDSGGLGRDASWFLARSVSGYGSGLAIQTTCAALGPSVVSTTSVVGRLVAGFSTLSTNAILPRLIHRGTSSGEGAARLASLQGGAAAVVGLACVVISSSSAVPSEIALFGLAAVWFSGATLNSVMQRISLRTQPARASGWAIAVGVFVSTLFWIIVATSAASGFILAMGAYVALDLITGVIYAVKLGYWRSALLPALGSLVVLGMLVANPALV